MHSLMSVIIIITSIFLSSSVQFNSATTFKPFDEKVSKCYPDIGKQNPQCNFWISDKASNELSSECVVNNASGSHNILRITGEFDILKIKCTAAFPVDFIYYGVQPTEAMFVEWQKEIFPNDDLLNQNYTVEVKVYSVQALFDYYNDPANNVYEYVQPDLPLKVKHDYSRSGNYSFPGIFNKTIGTWFYLMLEDSAKPSFLRNSKTIRVRQQDDDLVIPCVASHLNSSIRGYGPEGELPSNIWDPTIGFKLPMSKESNQLTGNYTCILKHNDSEVDTVQFRYDPEDEQDEELFYGLETLHNISHSEEVEVTEESPSTPTGYVRFLYPLCKTRDPKVAVDPDKVVLINVPSANFGAMRHNQQFALPHYFNRSYTARIVKGIDKEWDPLIRQIKQQNGVMYRMGTIYCGTGYAERVADIGSAVITGRVVPFNFGLDWATFNRKDSDIKTHFGISPVGYDKTKPMALYIDSQVPFECRVNVPVLVKPVVWYLIKDNGYVQELIDYNLNYDSSIHTINITADLKGVACASSYWYSDFWRNISFPVSKHAKYATKPSITDLEREYKFDLNSVNRNVRCSASGDPPPELYIEKDGKRFGLHTATDANSTILIIPKVDQSHAGTYTCVAKNIYTTTQKFRVIVEDPSSSSGDLVLSISIPLVVFMLAALAAYIYMGYKRQEKVGLSKQEVEDFMKGLQRDDAQKVAADDNEYTHEFAIMRPYVKEYEIPPSRFKIDESKVLGKGQFGLVLQGSVDENPVAVKTVQRNADKQYLKALLSELKIMIHLGEHENVIRIVGACTKDLRRGFVYVFIKYLPLGNLQSFLRHNAPAFDPTQTVARFDSPLSDYIDFGTPVTVESGKGDGTTGGSRNQVVFGTRDLIHWARQIASGMEYLCSKKVIHGDLAARNVLLDENRVAKVTDFGLSRQLYDYNDYIKKHQEPLPWRWMALESLKYMIFSHKSDSWSYAVTLWEIFSLGELPYPGYVWNLEFTESLENGLRMSKPKHAPDEIFATMYECWHIEPEKRPTFTMIRERIEAILSLKAKSDTNGPPEVNKEDTASTSSETTTNQKDLQLPKEKWMEEYENREDNHDVVERSEHDNNEGYDVASDTGKSRSEEDYYQNRTESEYYTNI